ncbi:MAG: glycosyltransferase [Verrucomicrobiota bacterium]
MPSPKPHVLLMGQTPPPWHGQAVATQILFDHAWPEFEVHRLRMGFSEEMLEVGRFQWKKIRHLSQLILRARAVLKEHPGCILFYPPASAKWIPFLRDVIFLAGVRYLAGSTVFIFHASGLPVFARSSRLRRWLGGLAYRGADVSLEVAQEAVTPHEVFAAKSWQWCPCAIEVPDVPRGRRADSGSLTVLFVGSLQEGKGVLEILATAAVLKQQGRQHEFRFRIVGKWFSEEFEASVRQRCSELGLGDMVELAGQLTGDDKWRAYADADVFFFPTHYASEATPLVLMEALGMGLPVVSTLWAGIPAMLDGCQTATLLPVRSPAHYAAALMDLRSPSRPPEQTARASRAFYRANFLPARFIERVAAAFGVAAAVKPSLESGKQKAERGNQSANSLLSSESTIQNSKLKIRITAYLADQNPGHDRSFGISRMSQVVLEALEASGQVEIATVASTTSQQAPASVAAARILPWGTRRKWARLLTDHLHPLFGHNGFSADLHYFPKGYLPLLDRWCRPSVVTIHDTIIQHDDDHYPLWRTFWEYTYWALMLKHTLRKADLILTVSESSKEQIHAFMDRHSIARKPITVTYEPCLYESIPQPVDAAKENYVIHLASCEPHKRTAHLIRWWHEAEAQGMDLPMLHLIGTVPPEVELLLASARTIVKQPFLEEAALQSAYRAARALILPSEIEGFGLPALEAYYLGTPVCFVKNTSVDEILGVATHKGGFSLARAESLFAALDEVMAMDPTEIYQCGLTLRATYAADKVAERMISVFDMVREEKLKAES